MTSSGIETATCRLLAQCLNQKRHRVTPKPLTVKCSLLCGKNAKINELEIQAHYIQTFSKVMDS
jgi:hypothetical protein